MQHTNEPNKQRHQKAGLSATGKGASAVVTTNNEAAVSSFSTSLEGHKDPNLWAEPAKLLKVAKGKEVSTPAPPKQE